MKNFTLWIWILGISMAITSCSKDTDSPVEPEVLDTAKMAGTNWVPARAVKIRDTTYNYSKVIPVTDASGKLVYDKANSQTREGKGYVYYDEKFKVVYVVDWPGQQGNASGGAYGFVPMYFNFDTRHSVVTAAAEAGTATWHLKHYDIYNAYMLTDGPAASDVSGKGKLRVHRTPFDELDEALSTPMVRTDVQIEMEEFTTVDGWGSYRLSDHILRPYKDRTIIFQLRDGRYVKYQLASLYRSNPTVVNDKYEFEAPFYNFRYFIQQTPEDRNLKTR
ncbi:hypothetical protein ACSBL2_01560 [Pedobacter sp. AW31-3R]|uniref:hypothetical protein n=1 Tax=Pedobacter sp. AW31-3R TaxID=3445781 RepID=UPI003F9F60DF